MSNILLISAPGAGKGVASKYLIEKYNLVHMSIGNLIREEAMTNTLISETIKHGNFIDNEIVNNLFSKFLEDNKNSSFVFEGFPRLMEQIEPFENILKSNGIILDKIIYIDIDKEIALKRITGRLNCTNCDSVYNKYTDNIIDNKCKVCGNLLTTRTDDKLETYKDRYELFIKRTIPVIEYFKNKKGFYQISNNGTLEELKSKIDEIMGK